jgi:hypothetical protein
MIDSTVTQRLGALGADLSRLSSLDPDARVAAATVAAELRRLGVDGAHLNPGNVEELAVRFEADHPAVAAALRQLADLLAKAGI